MFFFETGAFGVPSKSQKSFICGGVGQTITLKYPGCGVVLVGSDTTYANFPTYTLYDIYVVVAFPLLSTCLPQELLKSYAIMHTTDSV